MLFWQSKTRVLEFSHVKDIIGNRIAWSAKHEANNVIGRLTLAVELAAIYQTSGYTNYLGIKLLWLYDLP